MKRLLPILIILVLLFVIRNIVVSITALLQNEHTLTSLQNQLKEKKQEQAFLHERLEFVQSDKFIEEEAREKLNLVKDGEYIILLPSPPEQSNDVKSLERSDPNWKKWWGLFM